MSQGCCELRDAKRIVLLGECLIELNGEPFGTMHQSFGGDTFNTALYLARLLKDGAAVHYATALGTDPLSDEFLRRWNAEGIEVDLVLRDSARRPGLYWVTRDERGERSFTYWRGESAARHMMRHPRFHEIESALADAEVVYLSGISLAILPPEDRPALLDLLQRCAVAGTTVLYDPNYRPALWRGADDARVISRAMVSIASVVFATFDDEQRLWGDITPEAAEARLLSLGARAIVLKLGADGCRYANVDVRFAVPATQVPRVIDTTAAGDAFNAAFLAASMHGMPAAIACQAGNRLAARVIRHIGALIPKDKTPNLSELVAAHYRA